MPPPDDLSSLRDMQDAGNLAALILAGYESGAISRSDLQMKAALERHLSVIGEAMRRLTAEFTAANPGIPWSQWIGLRNVVVHAYDTIDDDQLVANADVDIPQLLTFLADFNLEDDPSDD
jgi:uncharacterized protein with HEPN domain